jgi:hypothetical protein
MCSDFIRSTVALNENSGGDEAAAMIGEDGVESVEVNGEGESGRESEPLRDFSGPVNTGVKLNAENVVRGVTVPGVVDGVGVGLRASEAARSKRLVVPSAFVDPERAEHTMATLC